MKLTDYFNVLLKDTVNLGQVKLDSLDSRVEAVYKALKADEQIGLSFNSQALTIFEESTGKALLSEANKGVLGHG